MSYRKRRIIAYVMVICSLIGLLCLRFANLDNQLVISTILLTLVIVGTVGIMTNRQDEQEFKQLTADS